VRIPTKSAGDSDGPSHLLGLARNGRDSHTLLEFCGLVGTDRRPRICVSDPHHPNDRLLLGMKGTMSEMELSVLRQRSLEALVGVDMRCTVKHCENCTTRVLPCRRIDQDPAGTFVLVYRTPYASVRFQTRDGRQIETEAAFPKLGLKEPVLAGHPFPFAIARDIQPSCHLQSCRMVFRSA